MYWKVFVSVLAATSISALNGSNLALLIDDYGSLDNSSKILDINQLYEITNSFNNDEKNIDLTEDTLKIKNVIDDIGSNDFMVQSKRNKRQEIFYEYLESGEDGLDYVDTFKKFLEIKNETTTKPSEIVNNSTEKSSKRNKRAFVLNNESNEYPVALNTAETIETVNQNEITKIKMPEFIDYQNDHDHDSEVKNTYSRVGYGRDNKKAKILKSPVIEPKSIENLFLDTYNGSHEIGYLVDDDNDIKAKALEFISNLYRIQPDGDALRFYLALFNSSSSTDFLESTNNIESFKKHLHTSTTNTSSELGIQHRKKSAATYAILKSAHFLAQNSGIIIFLERGPIDEDLTGHVRTVLLMKNIKLYVIWSGPYPTKTKEETLLMELCRTSGGAFLVTDTKIDLSKYRFKYYEQEKNNNLALLAYRLSMVGDNTISFPIDSEVTAIHVLMRPFDNDTVVLLTTPRGKRIVLTDKSKVEEYNSLSFVNLQKYDNLYEVHVGTNLREGNDVGTWKLKTLSATPTSVTVYVYTKLTANVFYVSGNFTKNEERHLKFEFLGNLLTVNKVTIQNKMGRLLMDNLLKNKEYLKVSEKYESINGNNITSNTNKVQDTQFQIALSKRLPDEKMYAVISGKDHRGYDFHRMALVKRVYDNDVFPQPPLTVALGLSSALIVQPNKFSDIYFEVTNRGNKAAQVYFSIKGEKHILYSMTPYRKIMSPDETTSVRVTIAPGPGTYQDRLTFQAGGGAVSVEKSVIVDVGTDIVDTESPDISHTYLSDCTANWGSCQDNVWTIEIKAKDSESGLLQVISNPKGIFFRNEFTSGTKEEVTGYYSGTCCRPEILITAVDRKENAYTKKYNAFHALWGPGAIAGLILGVLFILLLIAIIIIALHKWQKKRTVSYDLPVYRSKLRERY